MSNPSYYYDTEFVKKQVAEGQHRHIIGGLWDELGTKQLQYLKDKGLKPHHKLLDVGCGSLRLGVKAVPYLDPQNYFGTDINLDLLKAGYEKEIEPAGLARKLPKRHLAKDADFALPHIPADIDYVIAVSVFTHLPINHLKLFLRNLDARVTGPCRLFFSLFLCDEDDWSSFNIDQKMGVRTRPTSDPYHYSEDDVRYAASTTDWTFEKIEDWQHPRNQLMACFSKGHSAK